MLLQLGQTHETKFHPTKGANGFVYSDAIDYGCAGRGVFDPFSKTLGRQVDPVDKAFYRWKKCIQCATGKDQGMMQAYAFDSQLNSCGKFTLKKKQRLNSPLENSTAESRPLCECDLALISFLYNASASFTNYDGSLCMKANSGGPKGQCCNWDSFFYAHYNPDKSCCGSNGVQTAGTC